jgi:FMN phosphatase YigB (HAD superfamily)
VRAVVFDFGGVLWDMRWDVARELDRAHGLLRSSVFETLYRSEAWSAVERGAGDRDAWRREAHRALEQRAGRPLPALHDEWQKAQAPITPSLELVRLRPRYKTPSR